MTEWNNTDRIKSICDLTLLVASPTSMSNFGSIHGFKFESTNQSNERGFVKPKAV